VALSTSYSELRQSVVFAAYRRFDDCFCLLGPVGGTASVAHAERDLHSAEYIPLIGPLMESHFTGCSDKMAALAKVAKTAITTARHCHRPDVGIPQECYSFARGRYVK
jgi:hypothetical protein